MITDDWYHRPAHGWTCFFCGETFKTPGAARDHFGGDEGSTAACRIKAGDERGLVMELRKVEEELRRYRSENSDADRQYHAMRADHAQALIREEQKGYDKGLADGRAIAPPRPHPMGRPTGSQVRKN